MAPVQYQMNSKVRQRRNRNRESFARHATCTNCGKPGPHFIGPSLGESGYFACAAVPTYACSRCEYDVRGRLVTLCDVCTEAVREEAV